MTRYIDLNCDMGESYGRWTLGSDEAVMPYLTSANLACGFHAGDPHVMRKSVALAMRHRHVRDDPGLVLEVRPELRRGIAPTTCTG